MRSLLLFLLALVLAPAAGDDLHYSGDGRMLRPANYREWIWLSSGIGMSYTPQAGAPANPSFDNVFVNPAAYRSFSQTGKWPDKTIFVLEQRASQSSGSINRSGRFQTTLLGLDIHVKDESRFPGKWAFFNFNASDSSAAMIAVTASCYSCHAQHGAVDTTFVQFYPTLLDIAQQKKTLRQY